VTAMSPLTKNRVKIQVTASSWTKRLIAVPPFNAKAPEAKIVGATSSKSRTVSVVLLSHSFKVPPGVAMT